MSTLAAVRDEYEEAFQSILAGLEDGQDLGSFASSLSGLEPRSAAEQRMRAHLEAKWLLNSGRRVEARKRIEDAIAQWGPHVGLLADACVCRYLEGEHLEWRHLLTRLEGEFRAHSHELKALHRFKTSLVIGKFFEEDGSIASALRIYRETQEGLDILSTPEPYFLILAQRVRLNAQFDLREDSSKLYQELCAVELRHPRLYARIEIQHALALAESSWTGAHSALARALALEKHGLNEWDQRLVHFDLLEDFLSKGLDVSFICEKMSDAKSTDCDPYEKLLLELSRQGFSTEAIRTGLRRLDSLSVAGKIRILNLCIHGTRNRDLAAELARRLDVHLRALDPVSRKMWLRRFSRKAPSMQAHPSLPQVRVHFDPLTREIRSGERSRRLRSQAELLRGILHLGSGASIDRVAESVWNELPGAGWYDRTRMSLQRLNDAVFEITGERKAFYISQGSIHQSPALEFHVS
jgi:hypothetical protein